MRIIPFRFMGIRKSAYSGGVESPVALFFLDQLRNLALGRSARQLGDLRGCSLPFQQCQQHLEPRDTEHVREHAANLHVDLFQELLDPVPLASWVN